MQPPAQNWQVASIIGRDNMKRTICGCLSGIAVALVMITSVWGQDQDNLARYAREKRQEKQSEQAPKKVFDNDNLPREEHISVVGNAKDEPTTTAASNGEESGPAANNANTSASPDQPKDAEPASSDKTDASKTKLEVTPGESSEDRLKVYNAWKKKIADQKEALDLASRELDVMQREYRLRAAAVYADAGNRLRNAATWDKEDKQYKDQIAAKQKAVDDAKQKLADLQEQARRSGVPAKDRESN